MHSPIINFPLNIEIYSRSWQMRRVGFIGCGNMGASMARAFSLSSQDLELFFYDTDSEKSRQLASELKAQVESSLDSLIHQTEITILAVKPQILPLIYPELSK